MIIASFAYLAGAKQPKFDIQVTNSQVTSDNHRLTQAGTLAYSSVEFSEVVCDGF